MGKRVIIAGGGTGGHIFPALAIANALKAMDSTTEILFIGAKGKMEMEKVPQAGYPIEGLDIAGFNRSSLIKNFALPFKLIRSFFQVRSIFNRFKPEAAIGVGGYSSFPVLRFAQAKKIPTFIHESNSFAGKSNIMLGKKATRIFTGTDGMEKFFPASKIMVTGNPVRREIASSPVSREYAAGHFGLSAEKKTLLVVGGSLGARSINQAIDHHFEKLIAAGLQLIWQTGKLYVEQAQLRTKGNAQVWTAGFISDMDKAYAAADIVVSRSGAMSVAELCVAGKAVIFVPFPFAAEDHQTVNAMQLASKNAALIVKDNEVMEKLGDAIVNLAKDEQKQNELKNNISVLGIRNADTRIAEEIVMALSDQR